MVILLTSFKHGCMHRTVCACTAAPAMQFHLSVCQQARRESDSFCLYLASARERLSWTFIKPITTPMPNIWLLLPNITHQAWIKTCTYCFWPVHSPKPPTSHLPHKQRVCVHLHSLHARSYGLEMSNLPTDVFFTCSSNRLMMAWTHSTGLCAAMLRRMRAPLCLLSITFAIPIPALDSPRVRQIIKEENKGGGGFGLVFHIKHTPPRRHDTPPEVWILLSLWLQSGCCACAELLLKNYLPEFDLSIYLSVCLSVCLSIYLSIYLSIWVGCFW